MKLICPDCGAKLLWKVSRFGDFYGCEKWVETGCKGSIGVHYGTKEPLGIPAPKHVRELRIKCHDGFDKLWKNGGKLTRKEAYKWLQEKMCLDGSKAHIAMFDEGQCLKLISFLEEFSR
jgi:ssDNA-binding Zn-finger/Zn-ribbon topoisomerase 1